jgi:hypothetical protein
MSENSVFFLAVGIGIVAGLRALTAPAAVSSAGYLLRSREITNQAADTCRCPAVAQQWQFPNLNN